MDKNSIIGLLVIGGILIGWLYLSQPTKEQLAKQKQLQDSVSVYEQKKRNDELAQKAKDQESVTLSTSSTDSLNNYKKKLEYGDFKR